MCLTSKGIHDLMCRHMCVCADVCALMFSHMWMSQVDSKGVP